ncbi:MAG: glycosyltransferase family 4 protein [Rhizobacter sp.]
MTSSSFEPIRIGISLGNTGNFQDGLGEFSMQLCSRLANKAPQLKVDFGVELFFHMREKFHGLFGDEVSYLPVSRWQRWSHRLDQHFSLWHKLHQLNKTRPPKGTSHRLVTVHDLNFLYFKTGYSRWRNLRQIRLLLQQSTDVVTISDYVRKDVIEHMGWHQPIGVIYNGARSLVTAPCEKIAHWDGKPYLFHLSRMSKSKNIDAILGLARSWPEMNFVLAGPENGDTRAVAALLASEPMSNVRLLMSISDETKAWLYRNCLGFIFPSLTEGFGLPPIEAMHFGKPVFLSDRTCLPEIGGNFAAYFHDFSPLSMRSIIEANVVPLAARSSEIANHARAFDWDICCSNYLATYGKLLKLNFALNSTK